MVESADLPLRPSVDLYALAGVARYWISGQLPPPPFGVPESPRREKLADTVHRLRRTWPQLHYSAALLDALDNALSIYPAERPQGVAQMRARLGTASAAASGPALAARAAIPALSDPVPGNVAPSDAAPSDAAPSDAAPSDAAPSDVAPSDVAPSDVAPSDVVPSDVVPSDVVPSDVLPSDVVPSDVVPSDVVPSDVVPSDVVPSDVVPTDVVANEAAPNEALPSSPAPVPQAADRATQDFDVMMPVMPDPDRPATSGLARVDAPPMKAAFAPQLRAPRRIARWIGATLVLLSLLVIGVFEFGQERQLGRLLDALGVSQGIAVGDSDAVSAVGTAAPAPSPTAADVASVKPTPTEPPVAEPEASATPPAFPPSAAIPEAEVAQPLPTEPAAAPARPAGADRAPQAAAAAAATAEPPASAPPPAAVAPAPKRATQQQVARAPASPREVCGPRTQFSLYRCMKLQCSQQRWTAHAQCKRLRATDSVD
jgi:nucleosome-remodeling factor subunit BPTF